MDYITLVVLAVLLIILLYCIITTNININYNISVQPNLLDISEPIAIVDYIHTHVCTNPTKLQNYCKSWNYMYYTSGLDIPIINKSGFVTGKILYLNDITTDININQSLDYIINLSSNVKYIIFDETSTFLLNNSSFTLEQIQYEINDIELPTNLVKNILSEGYPYQTKNGLLLHQAYINNIFQNKNLPFKVPVIMPTIINPRSINDNKQAFITKNELSIHDGDIISSLVKSKIENSSRINRDNIKLSNNKTKIPKIIHQTFETRCIPLNIAMAAYSWINRNPEYEYRYYDDHDRREFIRNYFNQDVLEAYDRLIPGAYKADLWRYCVIYIHGGVYIDIKMGALVPLNKIIHEDVSLVLVNDTHDMTLYNAFFAAAPKHPAILKTIETVAHRINNEEYGNHILYPTGPMAMGISILPLYGYGPHAPNGKHKTIFNDETIQIYSHRKCDDGTVIFDTDDTKIIKTRYELGVPDSFINNITGRPNYRTLWNQRAIYRKLKY